MIKSPPLPEADEEDSDDEAGEPSATIDGPEVQNAVRAFSQQVRKDRACVVRPCVRTCVILLCVVFVYGSVASAVRACQCEYKTPAVPKKIIVIIIIIID